METLEESRNINELGWRDDGAYIFHHPSKHLWQRPSSPKSGKYKWKHPSLYIHVPFCRKICTFCTFERQVVSKGQVEAFTRSVLKEIELYSAKSEVCDKGVRSVYFGGGTASLLPNNSIVNIVDSLSVNFEISKDREITLECEPGNKVQADFELIRRAGVNRISVGVQAFQDRLLKQLGRAHTVQNSIDTVYHARAAGIDNVHIDLMYGLPNQSISDWKESLHEAMKFGIQHISCYPLIIFENEKLDRELRKNGTSPCSNTDRELMRKIAEEYLNKNGYIQYSLTEYSKDGFECEYVKATWDGSDYLGFGPGAYSRSSNELWESELFHKVYKDRIMSSEIPVGRAWSMSNIQSCERDLAMGLCLLKTKKSLIYNCNDAKSRDLLKAKLNKLLQENLLYEDDEYIYLSDLGKRFATHVMKTIASQ